MTPTKYMRIWRANNLEKCRANVRKSLAKWRKEHPILRKKKAKIQNNNSRFAGRREQVLMWDGYMCRICKSRDDLTVDHIDRDRKNNRMDNLQTLCRPCHGRKDGQARKIKNGWTFKRKK